MAHKIEPINLRYKRWHGLEDKQTFEQWLGSLTEFDIKSQMGYCGNTVAFDELDKIIEQGEAVNSPQLQEDTTMKYKT